MNKDSLRSLVSGLGDPVRDKLASAFYQDQILSDEQLLATYRTSWISKKIVNIPANDALRKWRNWQAEQDQITLIEAEEKRLGLQAKLIRAIKWARLWGGAVVYIGQPGDDLSEPWDVEKVKKGGIPYLTAMSRREIIVTELERDPISEFYGLPKSYEILGGPGQTAAVNIHPSRLVVFIGTDHPDPFNVVGPSFGWGDSVLQGVYDAVLQADSVSANIASLVFEANVDVFSVPGLMENLASEEYTQKLIKRFTLAAAAKSTTKALVLDTDEQYNRKDAKFQTLPEILQQFLLIVSGAADIPMTRFIGQSPAGLSSTGEGDMKNYYDRIQSMQTLEIGPALQRLDEGLIRSALGNRPPDIFYTWAPLEQMNEKDAAEIGLKHAQAAEILSRTGLYDPNELREAVTNQFVETSFYPGLGDITAGGAAPDYSQELGVQPEEGVEDAAPRTMYVSRKVVNSADIIAWAKSQGFDESKMLEAGDLHVTIAFSRTPVDWMKAGEPWSGELKVMPGGPRLVEQFDGGATVLLFSSSELTWRHQALRDIGASWDWPEYQPHITIAYNDTVDVSKIEPYRGEIVLGPEIFQEIDEEKVVK